MEKTKLNTVALGLALGIFWGLSVLVMGLIATHATYGKPFVETLALMYPGYAPTVMGSIYGGLIGFADAFIGGFLVGWLYNKFNR
jgi:hypothetical protein